MAAYKGQLIKGAIVWTAGTGDRILDLPESNIGVKRQADITTLPIGLTTTLDIEAA
jgi:hypothetical protein